MPNDNQNLEDLFFSANEFFDAKKYDKAFEIYQKILKNKRYVNEIDIGTSKIISYYFCYFFCINFFCSKTININ